MDEGILDLEDGQSEISKKVQKPEKQLGEMIKDVLVDWIGEH